MVLKPAVRSADLNDQILEALRLGGPRTAAQVAQDIGAHRVGVGAALERLRRQGQVASVGRTREPVALTAAWRTPWVAVWAAARARPPEAA
jgi:hypothetical protein